MYRTIYNHRINEISSWILEKIIATVKNNFDKSIYKKNIRIFGQFVDKPMLNNNFFGIKNSKNIFYSKNKNLAFAVIRLDDIIEPKIIDILSGIEELKFVHQINLKDY